MASNNKSILLVTHLIPYPPIRGIELRIFRLLKWLKEEGYRVILALPVESLDSNTLHELLKVTHAVHWTKPALRTRLGRRFPYLRKIVWERVKPFFKPSKLHDQNSSESSCNVDNSEKKRELCPDSLVRLVSQLAHKYRPQTVIGEYIFMTPCFEGLPPNTLRILDTGDVFSLKKDQVLAFGISDPYACTEEEERQHLLKADLVIAIQGREAEVLKTLVPERKVILTPIDFDTPDPSPVINEKSNTILVIGSDNGLNIHGLQGFLKECWHSIKTEYPAARLHVVGKVGARCWIEDHAVQYTPRVNDLTDVYREACVVINPTIAGTGLKVKSAEALAHGKPLVAWPNGVEGLEYSEEPPYVECHSWEEFGAAVVRLLRSEREAQIFADRARSYARERFNPSNVYGSLAAYLVEHSSGNNKPELANNSLPSMRGETC